MVSPLAPLTNLDDIRALRADLEAADYTVEHVSELLGEQAAAALHREQPIVARRVLRASNDAAATMVLFFTLGEVLDGQRLAQAFAHLGVQGLRRLRLLDDVGVGGPPGAGEAAGNDISAGVTAHRAACDLRPYGDENHAWWLASDLSEIATGRMLEPDHVLGIGGASTTLARWTPRREVKTALDLGTGCGVQAVHLDAHVERITATDLAERALAFVRFNAALNDLELDIREGSMLEPVSGETFDLMVSNPPFVITPRRDDVTEYEYRDGGAVGDSVIRDLVRDVGAHLNPGGVAQFLGNWEMTQDRGLKEVWSEWLADTDLDAWVIQREVQDPCEYAELWARDGGCEPGSIEYVNLYEAWLDDFASRGVTSIGFGIITLQKPATKRENFVDIADERGPVALAMGPTIDAGLRARTMLAEMSHDDILNATWQAAPDVTEERHTAPGASDPSVIMIRQGGGLGRSIQADTVLAAFMSVSDGSMSARVALNAIATLVEVDAETVITGTMPLLRTLIADGFLTLN